VSAIILLSELKSSFLPLLGPRAPPSLLLFLATDNSTNRPQVNWLEHDGRQSVNHQRAQPEQQVKIGHELGGGKSVNFNNIVGGSAEVHSKEFKICFGLRDESCRPERADDSRKGSTENNDTVDQVELMCQISHLCSFTTKPSGSERVR